MTANQPQRLFRIMQLVEEIAEPGLPKISDSDGEIHTVYKGSIDISGYGYILPTILEITSKKIHVHLLCYQKPQTYIQATMNNPYIHWEKYLIPNEVIRHLTKYDYGLMAFNKKTTDSTWIPL
jgi:hypothetical protein